MLTIWKILTKESKRFGELEGEYRYMGETRSGGDTLRLVIEEDGMWKALMVWGSACYRLKDRDEWIGWPPTTQAERQKACGAEPAFHNPREEGHGAQSSLSFVGTDYVRAATPLARDSRL